ncbi:MAG TPA: PaaI family thioesterase [Pyrinomonadaceae bacterium]|nr:PaaI family thioesterase [Pyrinomonadaceae bacterium]
MVTEPRDPNFELTVRESFARQAVMKMFGARLASISPGRCEIELPFREDLTQQNGYFHAGVVTTILDSACGFAAYSLMPQGSGVLSVEFKVNLVAPADGRLLRAAAEIKRAGRTLTVCTADAFVDGRICATMLATMFRIEERA